MNIPSLYTPKQVADYLHVSRGTIYSMISRQEIQSIKIGRNRRFTNEHRAMELNSNLALSQHIYSFWLVRFSFRFVFLPAARRAIPRRGTNLFILKYFMIL